MKINRSSYFGVTGSPFLGFFVSSQGGSFLGFQIPVMAEYYFGKIDDQNFYLGGGFSYGYLAEGGFGGAVLGPIGGLGAQFEIDKRLYGVRANYTLGINGERNPASGVNYTRDNRGMISLSAYVVI